ncbi:MAG: branched-chain amino acid transport system ATP-binding protein [Pseudomonadota bacterium]|jgi:branched-chain amino acid transport system ATP-binding protein
MKPMLELCDLHVFYGAIHALKGVNLKVFPGEVVSLVGANGAGKTTTLRALSGIIPCKGSILFKDQEIISLPPHHRVSRGLAQSPEGRGVFPLMTVEENLDMGAFIYSDKERIEKDREFCFTLFPRLKERREQLAGTLSGGEQQMVAISRALMARPELLLLDEPSLGLAPLIVAQIFEIIKHLNESKKTTILLVEQNARMALKFSHRAYVMETGKITLEGKASDLLKDDSIRQSYLGH